MLLLSFAVLALVVRNYSALGYDLGGWAPPLGLRLRADGISAAMMVMTGLILCLVGLSARPEFQSSETGGETRKTLVFWALFLGVASALNLVFLAQDLFNLFVALELLTFAAVPLVSLDGRAKTLSAALRYLLFALAGSVLYLLGVVLIYANYAALDLGTLHGLIRNEAATSIAVALMIAGLMAKTAVFPLHIWLPPAHSGAPAPASAILSALVIKAPFFIILRLWFDMLPMNSTTAAGLLAGAGSASILFCSVLALRQSRLKLMIAYSTVAQVGYLFLVFPLLGADGLAPWGSIAWSGSILQLMSHAFAKAAMFVAAGLIVEALGHDRIDDLAGAGKAAPLSVLAFAIAGLSLMGLPPSGGFVAKVMLLSGAVSVGEWWIAVTILVGGVLAAAYVFRVVGKTTASPGADVPNLMILPRSREIIPLILALCAVAIGFIPLQPLDFLDIGRSVAGVGP
ncbi:MAG: NADH-quinone oxidoreductase subunit J [Rhizobiaceae bacterium]|nr:NADH-quinone oxidoreductase subunit J [Rhizobiaceae bacterium]